MHLGIDIGGTTGRVSSFFELNDTTEFDRVEFPMTGGSQASFDEDIQALIEACQGLALKHGRLIETAGIAVAGKLDSGRQYITGAGNLLHWIGQPLLERLSEALPGDIVIGNDAEAGGLAETLYGHGRNVDFWYVSWGTGVGGCLVRHVNGLPVAFPGELGHQQVSQLAEAECSCEQYDCLEAFCGGNGISRLHGKPAEELTRLEWSGILGYMQVGIRNIVTAQPVPLVVFGGGIANKQAWLLPELQRRLARELKIIYSPEIKLSAFGESAGTVGALALSNNVRVS